MSTTVETLRAEFTLDTSQAEASAKRAERSMDRLEKSAEKTGKSFKSKMGDGIKSATAPAIGALGGLAVGAKMVVDSASDLGESINAVNVTFGKSADGIKRLSDEASTSVGLSKTQFNGLAVQFSSFAETVAGKKGDVVGTMDDLTTRAADFASVMNLDVADAAEKFQSGLAGETEPLKKFGIDLSAAKVEAYAYANGIAKQGAELTEAQKVQARYGALMEQTAKTQGDFANTSDGLANSTRIMKAQFEDTKAELGTQLLPVFTKFVNIMSDATQWAKENQDTVKTLAIVLGGLAAAILVVRGAMIAWSVAVKIVTAAQWLWNVAMSANPIGLIILAIAAVIAIVIVMYKKFDWFRNAVQAVWKVMKVVWGWAVQYIKFVFSVYKKVFEAIVVVVKWVWNAYRKYFGFILGAIRKVIDWVKTHWSTIKNLLLGPVGLAVKWIIQHWDKIKTTFGKVITFLKDKVRGIVQPFKQAFNKVVGIVKAAVNGIIGAWNAVDVKIGVSVPDWVPKYGGKKFEVDDVFPDIPMLANGGIVTKPTLAMIGEAGPEAVVPLSRGRGYGGMVINNPTFTTNVNGAHDPIRTAGRVADAEETMLRRLVWDVRTA